MLPLSRYLRKLARHIQPRHTPPAALPNPPERKFKRQTVTITVGGKRYRARLGGHADIGDFTVQPQNQPWEKETYVRSYRDVHGRDVLYARDRFPCFDEFDRANENRYDHYFLVFHEQGATAVHLRDDSTRVRVTDGIDRSTAASCLNLDSIDAKILQNAPCWERLPVPPGQS